MIFVCVLGRYTFFSLETAGAFDTRSPWEGLRWRLLLGPRLLELGLLFFELLFNILQARIVRSELRVKLQKGKNR